MVVIESHDMLSSWLTQHLTPICDADPSALAKYVLALLRKPDKTDEELKEVCASQLDVFLQANTKRFVETLFTALAEKSYVVKEEPTSSEAAPLEEKKEKKEEKERPKESRDKDERRSKKKDSSRERSPGKEKHESSTTADSTSRESVSSSDSRSRRPPLSGSNAAPVGKRDEGGKGGPASRRGGSPIRAPRRRISPPPADKQTRRHSRSPPRRRVAGRRSPPVRKDRKSRSRSPISDKERRRDRGDDSPKRKKRCRDFDEMGYCTRGDKCQFDHGPDPVVVDDSALVKMVGGGKPVVAPTVFNVPPPTYNNPPPPGVDTVGYNPEAPGLSMGDFSVPPPPLPTQWRGGPAPFPVVAPLGYEPSSNIPVDPHSGAAIMGVMGGMGGGGGIMRGRGRGRGRGGFHPYGRGGMGGGVGGGEAKETLAPNVASRTLVVKKIPPELNNIAKLNEHFSQFGNITNLQVHYDGPDSALISFSSRFEATNAYKNPEPIFNNRFIRVFWYTNLLEGGGPGAPPKPEAEERIPKAPIVLPKPGQTSYKNPEVVEARKKAKEVQRANKTLEEQILKLRDCVNRSTQFVIDLRDQEKKVIQMLMAAAEGSEKSKELNKLYKEYEKKIKDANAELAKLNEKLASLLKKKESSPDGGESPSSDEKGSVSPQPSDPVDNPQPEATECA